MVAEISVSHGDSNRSYQFARAHAGEDYWLKVSDRDELFVLTEFNANRIIENLNRQKLIEQDEAEDAPTEGEETRAASTSAAANATTSSP